MGGLGWSKYVKTSSNQYLDKLRGFVAYFSLVTGFTESLETAELLLNPSHTPDALLN